MTFEDLARAWIKRHEGLRLKPYLCPAGKLTVGYGHRVLPGETELFRDGITRERAAEMLEADILFAIADAEAVFPLFADLDPARKAVLVDMAFNLGREGLSEFKRFLAALKRSVKSGSYLSPSNEMMKSKWQKQVGKRASFLSTMMLLGVESASL